MPMLRDRLRFGSNNNNMNVEKRLPVPQQLEEKRVDAIKHSINVPRKHEKKDQNRFINIR